MMDSTKNEKSIVVASSAPLRIGHYFWLLTCVSLAFAVSFSTPPETVDSFYSRLGIVIAILSSGVAGTSFAFLTWLVFRRLNGSPVTFREPGAKYAVVASGIELLKFTVFQLLFKLVSPGNISENSCILFVGGIAAIVIFVAGFLAISGFAWKWFVFIYLLIVLSSLVVKPFTFDLMNLSPDGVFALAPILGLASLAGIIVQESKARRQRNWIEILGILLAIFVSLTAFLQDWQMSLLMDHIEQVTPSSSWQSYPPMQ